VPHAEQVNQVCTAAKWLENLYHRPPRLYRPPFGHYNDDALRAIRKCGYRSLILWTHTVDNGVFFSESGAPLKAGDIILAHYRPSLPQDLVVALQEISRAGLVPAYLDDYIS
jgi:peptidoglycan/xylan/chitin deacetylase (PgdA/CDA1 family)